MLNNCDGQSITQYADAIESVVEEELFAKLKSLPKVEMTKDSKSVRGNNAAKARLVELEGKINNLVNNLAECSGVTVTVLSDKINELAAERDAILKTLAKEIKDEIENPYEKIMALADNWAEATMDERKLVASLLIEKVLVADNNITVEWRI